MLLKRNVENNCNLFVIILELPGTVYGLDKNKGNNTMFCKSVIQQNNVCESIYNITLI